MPNRPKRPNKPIRPHQPLPALAVVVVVDVALLPATGLAAGEAPVVVVVVVVDEPDVAAGLAAVVCAGAAAGANVSPAANTAAAKLAANPLFISSKTSKARLPSPPSYPLLPKDCATGQPLAFGQGALHDRQSARPRRDPQRPRTRAVRDGGRFGARSGRRRSVPGVPFQRQYTRRRYAYRGGGRQCCDSRAIRRAGGGQSRQTFFVRGESALAALAAGRSRGRPRAVSGCGKAFSTHHDRNADGAVSHGERAVWVNGGRSTRTDDVRRCGAGAFGYARGTAGARGRHSSGPRRHQLIVCALRGRARQRQRNARADRSVRNDRVHEVFE